jgi:23S rRNA pseudouridine1911/1915/1917 synthase
MVRLSKSREAATSPWVRIPLSPLSSPLCRPYRFHFANAMSDDTSPDWETDAGPDREEDLAEVSTWQVEEEQRGQRLDLFVAAALPGATRSEAQRLIAMPADVVAGVRVNGRREKANYRVRSGDTITALPPTPTPADVAPEDILLTIIYEDSDLLVIDKPRGMVVHPAPGSPHGTLVNAVLAHAGDLSGIGGELRPGIVHRLDKDTGGLLVVAKNDAAHRALQAQIQSRAAERRYQALVWGVPHFHQAQVEAPIGRHPSDRKKMAVITDTHHTSRPALTELTVRETFLQTFALLEARLQTGRTHQIRVHCAYIRHPIVGDPLYGGLRKVPSQAVSGPKRAALEQAIADLKGQALHAYALSFDHPRTGERLAFQVPLPVPFQSVLDILR